MTTYAGIFTLLKLVTLVVIYRFAIVPYTRNMTIEKNTFKMKGRMVNVFRKSWEFSDLLLIS